MRLFLKSMNISKCFLRSMFPLIASALVGCSTANYYPPNFVESLKHPTKFPEVFTFNVQNIEEVIEKNPLGETEEVKITDVGENKNSSMHLIQVRANGEIQPHYHKRHDKVIYVKKGTGIATLDDTRYVVKPGSMLQVPLKTVFKFLNTGNETFVAVSIFSPPFDGKDVKKIKVKKKRERAAIEEKRLVAKKTETNEIEGDTYAANEYRPTKTRKLPPKPPKERRIESAQAPEPVPDDFSAAVVPPSPPIPHKKVASSEGKKKPKKEPMKEDSSVDIKDLHENLTKLVALKEEGSITAEEYEQKKDLLVKGGDIGVLPEPRSFRKKRQLVLEEDDDTLVPQLEGIKQRPAKIKSNARDTLANVTPPPRKKALVAPEVPQEDKLQTLDDLLQEGVITNEDYISKREALVGAQEKTIREPPEEARVIAKEKTPATPATASNILPTDDKVKDLGELYHEGLITEEDYRHKLSELLSAKTPPPLPEHPAKEREPVIPANKAPLSDEKIRDLEELYGEGLISEEDYQLKLGELLSTQTQRPSSNNPPQKGIDSSKLLELEEMLDEGIISEEDYDFKKAQLLGK